MTGFRGFLGKSGRTTVTSRAGHAVRTRGLYQPIPRVADGTRALGAPALRRYLPDSSDSARASASASTSARTASSSSSDSAVSSL